jgi:murein DD-endopeptidase MepM/ murein hydrolase activator NlpD
VQNLTGWQDVLGCRITIDHGNGWTTLYGHLKDSQTGHACDGILIKSGHVTRLQKIGIIAGSGSGGGGDAHAHLHFVVKNNNRKSDPSGWEPNPSVFPDPWAGHTNGTASYPMWMYSIRSTQAFDPGSGGQLASPTHQVLATIPPGFYTEQLMFNLSNEPVANATPLVNTGHSFSLSAMDNSGQVVHQLNQEITLEVNFSLTDLTGINTDTLSIYYWNPDSNRWVPLQTNIDWDAYTATAQVDHLSIFALLGRTENVLFLPTVNRGR